MQALLTCLGSRLRPSLRCICFATLLLTACVRNAEPPAAAPEPPAMVQEPPAAAQNESVQALNARWTALAGNVPESLGALHARLDRGGQAAGRPPVPADDLETARVELRRAESLWSKAQAAFATGNLPEAVTTATAARATLDGVAGNWPQSAR